MVMLMPLLLVEEGKETGVHGLVRSWLCSSTKPVADLGQETCNVASCRAMASGGPAVTKADCSGCSPEPDSFLQGASLKV